jgi:hypothetical protein
MSKQKYFTGRHASCNHPSIGIPGVSGFSKSSTIPIKVSAPSTIHQNLFALLSENSSPLGNKSLRSQAFLAKSKTKPADIFANLPKELSLPDNGHPSSNGPNHGSGPFTKPSGKTLSSSPSKFPPEPMVKRSGSCILPKNKKCSNNNDDTQQKVREPVVSCKLVSPHLQTIARLRDRNSNGELSEILEGNDSSDKEAAVALMRMKSSNEALWQSVKGTTLARYRRLIGTVARKHLKIYFTIICENVVRFRLETLAARRIQRLVRSFLLWLKEEASICIQSVWRGYMARQLFRDMKEKHWQKQRHCAAIKVQSHTRKYQAMRLRDTFRKEKQEDAVIKIQSRLRSFNATRLKRKRQDAIILIQTYQRRHKQQQKFHEKKKACRLIQKEVRQYQERQRQYRFKNTEQQEQQQEEEEVQAALLRNSFTDDLKQEILEIESLSGLSLSPPPLLVTEQRVVDVVLKGEYDEGGMEAEADPSLTQKDMGEKKDIEEMQETNDGTENLVQQLRERVARRKLKEFAVQTIVRHAKVRQSACIVLQRLCRRLKACRELALRREVVVTSLMKQLELTWTTEGPFTSRYSGMKDRKDYINWYTEKEEEVESCSGKPSAIPLFLSPHDPQNGILPSRHGDLPWHIRSMDTFPLSSLYILSIE